MMLVFEIFCPFGPRSEAQDTQKNEQTIAKVKLSEQEWKAFPGYFQSPANKDLYVQFQVNHDTLVGKTLWNNNVFHLLPQSSLAFVSVEEGDGGHVHLDFLKDSAGEVNKLNLGNNNVWTRAKNYKPVVKTEMQHTPDQLNPYEGLYQFQNDSTRFIQFTVKGNALYLKQHWDGREISFVPETPLDFFSKEIPVFSLSFKKDDQGNITQAVAFRNDVWNKTRRPEISASNLKSYEGKYQSKDDPDNMVQLISRHNLIVIKQLWDGKEVEVTPLTASYFYNDPQSFPLQILRDKDGAVSQIIILGMDYFDKVR